MTQADKDVVRRWVDEVINEGRRLHVPARSAPPISPDPSTSLTAQPSEGPPHVG
jgi:hypothetical protein